VFDELQRSAQLTDCSQCIATEQLGHFLDELGSRAALAMPAGKGDWRRLQFAARNELPADMSVCASRDLRSGLGHRPGLIIVHCDITPAKCLMFGQLRVDRADARRPWQSEDPAAKRSRSPQSSVPCRVDRLKSSCHCQQPE